MAFETGNWTKPAFAAMAAAALAFPLAGVLATPVDPTQAPADAEGELSAEQVDEARMLFTNWSCGVCHVLGDAGGTGHIGPSLDGNAAMDVEFIAARINNGQGAMPGFGGQMTDEEIDLLARYVMQAKQ